MSSPSLPDRAARGRLLADYLGACGRIIGGRRLLGVFGLLLVGIVLESGSWLALAALLRKLSAGAVGIGEPLGLFAAVALGRIAVVRFRDIALLKLRLDCLNALRNRLYGAITAAPWPVIARMRHANVLSVLMSDLDRINAGTYAVVQGVVTVAVGVVTLGVAFYVSPALAIPAVIAGAFLSLILLGQTQRTWRLGDRLTDAHRDFVANASDFLALLKLVKAQGGEPALLDRFERMGRSLDDEHDAFNRYQVNRRSLLELGGLVLIGGLLFYATQMMTVALPTLLLSLYLLSRLVPLISQSASLTQMATHMLPAWASFRHLESELAQPDAPAPKPAADVAPFDLRHAVELADVVVRHTNSDLDALAGVGLVIPARRTTALVGPSGTGKTTLADLVLGLLTPTAGSVQVDGAPLADIPRDSWQAAIAYVPQDTLLLPTTVRQNLVWDGATHDDQAIWDALELAQAATFVRRLPQGLDTVLGEHGAGLSGGERQRLMLARAFLRRPQLLVLDEATSHLDAESEQAIRRALRRVAGSMTILLIAHRLSTVADADQIVLMEAGGIVGTGSWDELLAAQPLFRQLVAADRAAQPGAAG